MSLWELKKQQQRYYALLNGAKRGLYAPKMYVKGSSYKLQRPGPSQGPRPLNVALGKKIPWNHDNSYSGIKITRGTEGKRWEVTLGQEAWNDTNMDTKYKNDNIIRGGDSNDQRTSLAKLNAAVYCPSARSHDQFTLLHGTVIPHGDHRNAPDHIIASGLSEFTGSARFNSSRHKGGLLTVGLDAYPLEEPYRISSGIASSTESVKEYGTKSTFPDATDILLERADTWRNTLSHSDPNNPLTRAPKAFQPKTWQSFKPEFTQPYRFTYFVDKQ